MMVARATSAACAAPAMTSSIRSAIAAAVRLDNELTSYELAALGPAERQEQEMRAACAQRDAQTRLWFVSGAANPSAVAVPPAFETASRSALKAAGASDSSGHEIARLAAALVLRGGAAAAELQQIATEVAWSRAERSRLATEVTALRRSLEEAEAKASAGALHFQCIVLY